MNHSWKIAAIALSLAVAATSVACGGASEPDSDGESENTINAPLRGDKGAITNPIGGPIKGGPTPGDSGSVSTTPGPSGGPGAFDLCERNKCPAQIPSLARVCDNGSIGVPECIKYKTAKRCEWTFVCGL